MSARAIALTFAAAVAVVAASSAAAVARTATLSGVEVAATATAGTFVGKGRGSSGERLAWTAVAEHTRLRGGSGRITGGTFSIATARDGLRIDGRAGTFTGGAIKLVAAAAGCGRQQFSVSGRLGDVRSIGARGGTGTISIRLTHFRRRVFGRCVTYGATVAGSVTLGETR